MGIASRLAYPAYRLAERAACALPLRLVGPVVTLAAWIAYAALGGRRRMVGRHLRRVKGAELGGADLRRATVASFQSYASYWLDTFRLGCLAAGERSSGEGSGPPAGDLLEGLMDADGLERLDDALAGGRGAVLATAHLGSWDLGGSWLARQGYPLVAVVERLQPPALLEWFVEIRRRIGMEVVVRGPGVWEELEAALGRNEVVVLVCDRDLSGRGVEVEFFGERTTLPTGPARLARRCGAPLFPVAVYDRPGGRHHGVVRPPVAVPCTDDDRSDVAVAAQLLAWELEELIRRAPEQWHLMQPNWPSDRSAARR